MSTNATLPSVKTALVTITYRDDTTAEWVRVLSHKTGNALEIDLSTLGMTWTNEEVNLFSKLMKGDSPRTTELSYSDLITFKSAHNRLESFLKGNDPNPIATNNVPQITTKTLAPIATIDPPISQKAEVPQTVKESAAQVVQKVESRTMGHSLSGNAQIHQVERRIDQLQRVIDTVSKDGYVMLVYDIPTNKVDDCPNPSSLLWHHGFRMNLSCWVLPKNQLQHYRIERLLAHWRDHKIVYHVVPYAEEAIAQIRSIARDNLAEEIGRIHKSMMESIIAADQVLSDAEATLENDPTSGEKSTTEIEAKRNNHVRQAIKIASERLAAAASCASTFDETESLSDLLEGLRNAVKAQAEAWNARTAAQRLESQQSNRRGRKMQALEV